MARSESFEIAPHREHHLANVTPLHRPVAINPRHPSLYEPTMFDQEQAPPDECVKITRPEAARIIAMLGVARPHLASPMGVDEAIRLLGGKR